MTEETVTRSAKSTSDPEIIANFVHRSEGDSQIIEQIAQMQFQGLPYEGPIFNRKEDDPEKAQPQLKYDAFAKVFDMSKAEDVKEYESIWTKSLSGEYLIGMEKTSFDKDMKTWLVFLRWVKKYYVHPSMVEQKPN